ncbi:MAG: DUF2911 domain-containing protein [Vicinamibacterales bacterium]
MRVTIMALAVVLALGAGLSAQQGRPASPPGAAATQVGNQWVEITYGRPILRGRTNIFGSGADYGVALNDGGPVWRAGANDTTLLRNAVALEIGGRRVPAGAHAILIELRSPTEWTFILSAQARQRSFDPNNTTELWGGFNYRPDRDVARAPMTVETLPYSVDQLTWLLTDVTPSGGTMRVLWERTMGSVGFKVIQ